MPAPAGGWLALPPGGLEQQGEGVGVGGEVAGDVEILEGGLAALAGEPPDMADVAVAAVEGLAERLGPVEDFVDFLRKREAGLQVSRTMTAALGRAFREVWDNPEDAVYDEP